MPNRTDLLNHLAMEHNLKTYLEIGVQDRKQNFDKIICRTKVGVDPDPNARAEWCTTSDDFFLQWQEFRDRRLAEYNSFDLVFIDGLHTAEQVQKDFENALKILSPNGFIVIHDCNPEKEEHTIVPRPKPTGHWNGNVFQFAITIASPHYGYEEGYPERPVTVDVDNGCLVYRHGQWSGFGVVACLAWGWFDKHRKEYLNLISWEDFIKL
jgi:SAM-dependent methyltransferase